MMKRSIAKPSQKEWLRLASIGLADVAVHLEKDALLNIIIICCIILSVCIFYYILYILIIDEMVDGTMEMFQITFCAIDTH